MFISDKIATAHGGSIKLESRPDEGTRFVVQLPREVPVDTGSDDDLEADNTLLTAKETTDD